MATQDITREPESGTEPESGPIRCTCHFFNQTGVKIHVKLVRHTIDDNKKKLLENKDLGVGESVACKDIFSYAGVPRNDYWHVEFTANSKTYSNPKFYCNLTSADNKGDVVLRVDLSHLHVDPPKSSGCTKTLNKK
jgi:hypothetical protein